MSLAVGSFTTAYKRSGDLYSTVETLSLPAGMNVGDLLLFSVVQGPYDGIEQYGESPRLFDPPETAELSSTVTIPAGFARLGGHGYRTGQGSQIQSHGGEFIYYKVVDGTETDYTFQNGQLYLSFIHITGWNGSSASPLHYATHNGLGSAYYYTPTSEGLPLTRTDQGILIMQGNERYDTNDPSTPVITSAGGALTWTEIYSYSDFGVSEESGFCFYAVSTDNDSITAFSITNAPRGMALYYLGEPQDAAGGNTFFTVDPTFPSQSAVTDSTLSNEFFAVAPAFPSISGRSRSVPGVDNLEKPSTSTPDNLAK